MVFGLINAHDKHIFRKVCSILLISIMIWLILISIVQICVFSRLEVFYRSYGWMFYDYSLLNLKKDLFLSKHFSGYYDTLSKESRLLITMWNFSENINLISSADENVKVEAMRCLQQYEDLPTFKVSGVYAMLKYDILRCLSADNCYERFFSSKTSYLEALTNAEHLAGSFNVCDANYWLGDRYFSEGEYERAFDYWKRSGNTEYVLMCYEYGIGVEALPRFVVDITKMVLTSFLEFDRKEYYVIRMEYLNLAKKDFPHLELAINSLQW